MIPAAIVLVLALALVAFVARPLMAAAPSPPPDADSREADDQVAGALAEIEEIEFDRASGHLSDEDFAALSADAKRRAVELIRRREAPGRDRGGSPEG